VTRPILDDIKQLLLARGWKIDGDVRANAQGELHEFIHPETSRRRAWLDAVLDEGAREIAGPGTLRPASSASLSSDPGPRIMCAVVRGKHTNPKCSYAQSNTLEPNPWSGEHELKEDLGP
jgi:hypothetical protein